MAEWGEIGMGEDWETLLEELELIDLNHAGKVGCPATNQRDYIHKLTQYRHRTDWLLKMILARSEKLGELGVARDPADLGGRAQRKKSNLISTGKDRITFRQLLHRGKFYQKERKRAWDESEYRLDEYCSVEEVISNPLNKFIHRWNRACKKPRLTEAKTFFNGNTFLLECRERYGWQYEATVPTGLQYQQAVLSLIHI